MSYKLVFDFDGVLVNSVSEAAVVAFSQACNRPLHKEDIDPLAFGLFIKERHHVQPAGDMCILATWCSDNIDSRTSLSSADYRSLVNSAPSDLRVRTRNFFQMRHAVKSLLGDSWYQLNSSYEPLVSKLRSALGELGRQQKDIFICTNKNLTAVLDLCAYFEIPIEKENIYTGDNGATKIQNLIAIANSLPRNQQATEFLFIEDSIKNLIEVISHQPLPNSAKLTPLLADWGYLGSEDLRVATTNNIGITTQELVIAKLQETCI